MLQSTAYYEEKAKTVAALAHPIRLQILDALSAGEASTGALVLALDLPQPLVSQHLSVLRAVGVVLRRRDGARAVYRLADPAIAVACGLMGDIAARLAQQQRERLTSLAGLASGR